MPAQLLECSRVHEQVPVRRDALRPGRAGRLLGADEEIHCDVVAARAERGGVHLGRRVLGLLGWRLLDLQHRRLDAAVVVPFGEGVDSSKTGVAGVVGCAGD